MRGGTISPMENHILDGFFKVFLETVLGDSKDLDHLVGVMKRSC